MRSLLTSITPSSRKNFIRRGRGAVGMVVDDREGGFLGSRKAGETVRLSTEGVGEWDEGVSGSTLLRRLRRLERTEVLLERPSTGDGRSRVGREFVEFVVDGGLFRVG